MKALLGIVGGFVLTLAVFASGLAFATWLLAAKPVRQATPAIGVSELWTKDARPVDPAKQDLERIPAQQTAGASVKADEGGQRGGYGHADRSSPNAASRRAAAVAALARGLSAQCFTDGPGRCG